MSYENLPQDRQGELKALADHIRSRIRRSTKVMIEVGSELIAIKESLKHGEWTYWVEEVLGMALRTVQNYMQVAAFAIKDEKLALLSAASLKLINTKDCPPKARAAIMAMLDAGSKISDRVVTATIDEHKPKPTTITPEPTIEPKPTTAPEPTTEPAWPAWAPTATPEFKAARQLFDDMVETLVSGPEGLLNRILAHEVQIVIDRITFVWPTEPKPGNSPLH